MDVQPSRDPGPSLPIFPFGGLRRLLRWLVFLTCAALLGKIYQEALRLPHYGFYYTKDTGLCRKRFAWKRPILGHDSDWHPFLTSDILLQRDASSMMGRVLLRQYLPFGLRGSGQAPSETLKLLPHQGMPQSISSLRCKKCVVVGNSYNLLGRHLGKFIDSHNVVIRMNNAPLKGYEEDVGERTTIRFFYPESALADPLENSGRDTYFFLLPFKTMDFLWAKAVLLKNENLLPPTGFWPQAPKEWKGNASHFRIINPYVIYQTNYHFLQLSKYTTAHPTTGIIAVNFALHLCQEVNIVGFGYPKVGDPITPQHYYETQLRPKEELVSHDFAAEQNKLRTLWKWQFISDVLYTNSSSSWVWGPQPQW